MALTITYDGYGVVANADATTNDTGGSGTGDWKELGGGTISLNPDVYLYGASSIGSKYASKSGYTYIDGITPLDFSVGGTEEGQYIYIWLNIQSDGAFLSSPSNGFSVMIGSSTSDHYMWRIANKAQANGWTGGWKLFVIDPTITTGAIQTGTPDLSAIDTIGVWIDTDVSVRAESIFISQISCMKGLKIEGTSTTMFDDIVAWCEDYTNRAAGVFQSRGQTYYSLGSLTIHSDTTNTVVSQDGANVEYEKSEFWDNDNTTGWVTSYPTDANLITIVDTSTNTTDVALINTGLSGNDTNTMAVDSSLGTDFDMSGGYIKYMSSIVPASSNSFDGVVFSLSDAIKPIGASLTNCYINSTTEVTTGALELANSTDLNTLSNLSFNEYTGKYALYIPASITGTITLNNFKGDNSGTDVYWAATSGTLIINKSNGTNFTTWSAGGTATVSLVTSVSIDINIKDQSGANIPGALVYVDEDLGQAGNIVNTATDINGNIATSYSGGATTAKVRVRKYGFKPYVTTISLSSDSQTNVVLVTDPQQT